MINDDDIVGLAEDCIKICEVLRLKRNSFVRVFHAKYDKEKIRRWNQEIHKIRSVFSVGRSYYMLFSGPPN